MPAEIHGRIGLIGDPVAHSLSPAFQQAAFDALGIPLRYELLHTPDDQVNRRLEELRSGAFTGVNVTVPHKETFFVEVDERSEVATRVGAVNTIVCSNGRLFGDNTDVFGFTQSLVDIDFRFAGIKAVILGAGGASRAVVVALLDNGAREIVIANRSIERARRLATDMEDARLVPVLLTEVGQHLADVALIVNATALGWHGNDLPIDRSTLDLLDAGTIAYDLTYRSTPFLDAATRSGLTTVDGLGMLVHQGARSFELWTGRDAPVDVMWKAALSARN